MSKGTYQKVVVVGNLGRDPDMRSTTGGASVANLAIATTEAWKDKTTGEAREETEWHRVVLFGRLAEIAGQYLTKGAKVLVEGRLKTRKWQDQSGQDRYSTEIVAGTLTMLGGNTPVSDSKAPTGGNQYQRTTQPSQAAQAPTPADSDLDDDIPF